MEQSWIVFLLTKMQRKSSFLQVGIVKTKITIEKLVTVLSNFSSGLSQFLKFVISGKATRVQFHVTVMSLDSIDEGSMVSLHYNPGGGRDYRGRELMININIYDYFAH